MLCWNYLCEVYTHGSCLVDVIIFLAPVSSFNQALAEDESVNRLVSVSFSKFYTPRQAVWRCSFPQTDTFKLWQMICANKLLAEVELILFLNKFDILATKLKAGVEFTKYVPAYGSRPNELKPVATCVFRCSLWAQKIILITRRSFGGRVHPNTQAEHNEATEDPRSYDHCHRS